jgi:hypothetical protein
MSQHSVTFINGSSLPIILETFQQIYFGVSQMKSITVKSGETAMLNSDTGEWILHTYIYDTKIANEWLTAGYEVGKTIGKFRNTPCIRGDYSWMEDDDFQIVYDKDTKSATFSKK